MSSIESKVKDHEQIQNQSSEGAVANARELELLSKKLSLLEPIPRWILVHGRAVRVNLRVN